jgi:hypothetical protein
MEVGLIILIVLAILFFVILPITLVLVLVVGFRNDRFCLSKDKKICEFSSQKSCSDRDGTFYQTMDECKKHVNE